MKLTQNTHRAREEFEKKIVCFQHPPVSCSLSFIFWVGELINVSHSIWHIQMKCAILLALNNRGSFFFHSQSFWNFLCWFFLVLLLLQHFFPLSSFGWVSFSSLCFSSPYLCDTFFAPDLFAFTLQPTTHQWQKIMFYQIYS